MTDETVPQIGDTYRDEYGVVEIQSVNLTQKSCVVRRRYAPRNPYVMTFDNWLQRRRNSHGKVPDCMSN